MAKQTLTTKELVEKFAQLKAGMISSTAKYALEQDAETDMLENKPACTEFCWMMYEQLTGDAAASARRAVGGYMADLIMEWAKPRLFNPQRDRHY